MPGVELPGDILLFYILPEVDVGVLPRLLARDRCYTGTVMSSLSPRLQVRVQQKQILTPGLVQMVSLLQLNRLELKEMISAEIAQNPVLEEAGEAGEELSAEELQPLLEAER